jgi:transposase
MRQEVLIGVERRRRWSIEQKLQVLAEVGVNGATVADVARRHDLSRQQIDQWRRDLRRGGAAPVERTCFLPVELAAGGPEEDRGGGHRGSGRHRVEIALGNGRTVCADAGMPENLLMRVIRVAERA